MTYPTVCVWKGPTRQLVKKTAPITMVNLTRRSTEEQKNDDKDDEVSIDLTPDPNALQVLQIKPPKKGEALNDLDAEKVYR